MVITSPIWEGGATISLHDTTVAYLHSRSASPLKMHFCFPQSESGDEFVTKKEAQDSSDSDMP